MHVPAKRIAEADNSDLLSAGTMLFFELCDFFVVFAFAIFDPFYSVCA